MPSRQQSRSRRRAAGRTGAGRTLAAFGAILLAGCGGSTMVASATTVSHRYATTPVSGGAINPRAIPLGDGYTSQRPRVGYVDSCQTSFPATGGAQNVGPWINTRARTWNYETKIAVNGAIRWPQGSYSVRTSHGKRIVKFNDLPTDHTTGVFPIARSDRAHAYDANPNRIEAQSFDWSLALHPAAARKPSCTGGGPIGVLNDGVVLYNALDGEGRDAGAHEVLDLCAGHPDQSSTYHHHDIPPCILRGARNGRATLVGFALDGYGIYVVKNAHGTMPTNRDLDACHGTTSVVSWNGRRQRVYHYVATLEYPYTVGCFHGTPISSGHGGPPV